MEKRLSEIIALSLNIRQEQTEKVINLLFNQGASIPFISRYRKEMTGGLNEIVIENIKNEFIKLSELEKRKETIRNTISEQGKLTDELAQKINLCYDAALLEDLYLPYKPKQRTRATIAREKGLEPLAGTIMKQQRNDIDKFANNFIGENVPSKTEALKGACDIMAEWISEHTKIRAAIRKQYEKNAVISSKIIKGKEIEGNNYTDYFDFKEPVKQAPSHRILAMLRGKKEGILRISINLPSDEAANKILSDYLIKKGENACRPYIEEAMADSYKRLIKPSLENEFFSRAKEKADKEAIAVFAQNLRQLLLAPPLGQKTIMAIDPGFRTGCKIVCLDNRGNLVYNETIYPHPPQKQEAMAIKKIVSLVDAYKIEAIAIGNGTAGKETENLIRRIHFNRDIHVFVISEDGASVYSASPVAREEFPKYDVTVRGAVSIGRRLMDPLAELVKIEPKSIGVGQYQHDVEQGLLKEALDRTVESCVNLVGVNLNTASKHLLTYVSGIGPVMAARIVEYRNEHGSFTSREQLLNIPRLGKKVFEQCAGFLRIPNGINPLDNSAVHPESYGIVEQMAKNLNKNITELIGNDALIDSIDLNRYVNEKTGIPTLTDIITELKKPGRDPRQQIKVFEFSDKINSIDDLEEGMVLPGIISNITNFGAFVDIGLKQKGLIHISEIAAQYVADIHSFVKLYQHVTVKVIHIDKIRNRIALSMKEG